MSNSDVKFSLLTGTRHKTAMQFLVTLPKFSHSSKETRYTFPGGILIPLSTRNLSIMKYTLPSISTAPRIFGGNVWLVYKTYNSPVVVFLIIHFNRTCSTAWLSIRFIDGALSPSNIEPKWLVLVETFCSHIFLF